MKLSLIGNRGRSPRISVKSGSFFDLGASQSVFHQLFQMPFLSLLQPQIHLNLTIIFDALAVFAVGLDRGD